MEKTYRLDKLYFQFMLPKGIPLSFLDTLVEKLILHNFIIVHNLDSPRYTESPKMRSGEHKQDLYKIIQGIKTDSKNASKL